MPGPSFRQEAPAAQQTADSTPEPSFRQEPVLAQQDRYARHITQEGISVQTLQPPAPDAAQAVAGRLRRARAALAARTRQMHGPLPMLPRKLLPRPASPAPATLEGQTLWVQKRCITLAIKQLYLPFCTVRTMKSCHLTGSLRCAHLYTAMRQFVNRLRLQESLPGCTRQKWQWQMIPECAVIMTAACPQDWLCCMRPKRSYQMRLMSSDCIAEESAAFKLMKLPTSAT